MTIDRWGDFTSASVTADTCDINGDDAGGDGGGFSLLVRGGERLLGPAGLLVGGGGALGDLALGDLAPGDLAPGSVGPRRFADLIFSWGDRLNNRQQEQSLMGFMKELDFWQRKG